MIPDNVDLETIEGQNWAINRIEALEAALLKYAEHKPNCASGNIVSKGTLYNKYCDCGLSAVASASETNSLNQAGSAEPFAEDIEIAAQWLEANEGGDGEAESCRRVAAWLDAQASAIEERRTARAASVPVAKLRQVLARVPNPMENS
jgi:hypothetical protein